MFSCSLASVPYNSQLTAIKTIRHTQKQPLKFDCVLLVNFRSSIVVSGSLYSCDSPAD